MSKPLSETGQKVIETFGKVLPHMNELEKERLLAFGEGIAFKVEQQKGENGAADCTDSESESNS